MSDDIGCPECGHNACMCADSPNNPDYTLGRYDERMAIMSYLRSGGETVRGQFYAWDREMRGYYASIADRIASGDHVK